MCGITGFAGARREHDLEAVALTMTGTLAHRGPDDAGVWIEKQSGVALGHRRLSILDLSPEGHQPMMSLSGRYVMVFNGEIYNYLEIRAVLESETNPGASRFRGSSDTEVMLAAFERWGIDSAVRRFNGMFALAVWDRTEHVLYLARDRAGEKPLYYAWMGDTFLFGSELKALRVHPAFRGDIDRGALALFMRHGYIPAPYSIYESVRKLPPGTILLVKPGSRSRETSPVSYWSAKDVAETGSNRTISLSDEDAADGLEGLLSESVRLRMVSDVPLGAFLSGGIDSSTIVALMQKHSARPVKTFSIGFYEFGYNEAGYAKEVARHIGTEHTELYVTPSEAMSVVPQLPTLYDEPFADSSQIPTFLVSRLARQHVTVSLSGDAGDELFGGYTRYQWAQSIWERIGWIPVGVRRQMATLLMAIPPQGWTTTLNLLHRLLPRALRQTNPADKVQKLSELLPVDGPESLYLRLVSQWNDPTSVVLNSSEPPTLLTQRDQWASVPDFARKMMFLDTVTYLPDDILVKLDRASMGVSLESRVPFLDHRVIEFAWQLPPDMRIRNGQTKWLLRRVLDRYVPTRLVDRPKSGFGIPIHEWLRGPLRTWAEELLDADRMRREGFLDPAPIRKKWSEHLSGKHNWMYPLWNVLMFQAWLQEERSRRPATSDSVPAFA